MVVGQAVRRGATRVDSKSRTWGGPGQTKSWVVKHAFMRDAAGGEESRS